MTAAFDNRRVALDVQILNPDTGAVEETFSYDQSFFIVATGTKYTNGNFGEFVIRIDNISKASRDFLVTKTSLWTIITKAKRANANIVLSVGRESYGTFVICQGNAIASNPTQPPDIGLIFKSLALGANMGVVNAFTAAPMASLQSICEQVAQNNGLVLKYEAKQNPNIGNYHFTGAIPNQIKSLNNLGYINAFVDDPSKTLVVTDQGRARQTPVIEVNAATGMVGVPEVTEIGARARMLIQNNVKVGDPVNLQSNINPAVNGKYYIAKLSFEVASRDTPFYWLMDLRIPFGPGA